jgi:hypothetical protein
LDEEADDDTDLMMARGATTFEEFLHMHEEIRDHATHDQLQRDLIEH